jgi:hypothetical protein
MESANAAGLLGQFGPLIHDYHERGIIGRGFPYPFSRRCHPGGPLVQFRDGVAEELGRLFRGEREPVKARGPRLEFHAS